MSQSARQLDADTALASTIHDNGTADKSTFIVKEMAKRRESWAGSFKTSSSHQLNLHATETCRKQSPLSSPIPNALERVRIGSMTTHDKHKRTSRFGYAMLCYAMLLPLVCQNVTRISGPYGGR